MNCSRRSTIPFAFSGCIILSALLAGEPAVARQQEASVGTVASFFAAVNNGRFVPEIFEEAAFDADVVVRRQAALAMGRIGDSRATPILLHLTTDPDPTTQLNAVFSLGLIGDPMGASRLASLVVDTPPEEQNEVHAEAVMSLARIGGDEAIRAFTIVLGRFIGAGPSERLPPVVVKSLGEAWRLGSDFPISMLTQYLEFGSSDARANATQSVVLLETPPAASVLLRSTEDPLAVVRATAIGALDSIYVERSGMDPEGVAARARQLTVDTDPLVRISALRVLSSFGGSVNARTAADRAGDVDPDVRVQALITVGETGGEESIPVLRQHLIGGFEGTRMAALASLYEISPVDALPTIREWADDPNWRIRAQAAALAGRGASDSVFCTIATTLLADSDRRVALQALTALAAGTAPQADSIRNKYLLHSDGYFRSAAASLFFEGDGLEALRLLVEAYQLGEPEDDWARGAVLQALSRMWMDIEGGRAAMIENFMDVVRPPTDPTLRRIARSDSLLRAWVFHETVGIAEAGDRGIADFGEVARRLIFPVEQSDILPRVFFETDRGRFAIELDPLRAPLGVNAFLNLVEIRKFDGLVWNRVAPGRWAGVESRELKDLPFVPPEPGPGAVEAGTVWLGGINRDVAVGGVFVSKTDLPQLQGNVTVIGRVTEGLEVVKRLSVGDRIRRVYIDPTGMTWVR